MKAKILKRWEELRLEYRILVATAAVSLALVLIFVGLGTSLAEETTLVDAAAPDVATFIPRGHVLIPIDVENYEAVDSILGKFGIVDLFRGGEVIAKKEGLIARNVRILRAPQNPSHFAILVPESEASRILREGAAFLVVVKRPEAAGTEIVKPTPHKGRRIVYEGG